MSKEKRRVPKLRFPGFTEDWEQRKFKDIAFKRGKISEADLPYIEFEDINSGIGTLNKNILQKVGHKKGILFEAGDVLFGKLRPYLQNWLLCQFAGIAVGDFWVLQPQNVSSAFLYYLIQSEAYQSVANISSGTKMPRSSWPLVSETLFSIPKYKEANMIGEFFLLIDRTITLHQRKLNNLKLKKKALLQKLFPKNGERYPELRFPGFTDAWEQRKLGEFVKIVSGDAPSTFISGNCIYVKVDDLNYSDRIQLSSSNLVNANPKAHLVNQGATIFPKRGAAIMTNKIRIMGKAGYLDTNMMALIPEEIDKDFLFTFIQKTGLYKIADTSTIPQINNKHIEPYMIQVPNEKEQAYIGVVFEKIDKIITLHQRKLDHLKLQKKALLQQMFV